MITHASLDGCTMHLSLSVIVLPRGSGKQGHTDAAFAEGKRLADILAAAVDAEVGPDCETIIERQVCVP